MTIKPNILLKNIWEVKRKLFLWQILCSILEKIDYYGFIDQEFYNRNKQLLTSNLSAELISIIKQENNKKSN